MDKMEVNLKDGLYLVARVGGRLFSDGLQEDEFIYYDDKLGYICYEDGCFIGNTWMEAYRRLTVLEWTKKYKFYFVEDISKFEVDSINKAIQFHEEELMSLYKRKSELTGKCVVEMNIAKDLKCKLISIEELAKRANVSDRHVCDLIYDISIVNEDIKIKIVEAYIEMIKELGEDVVKC